MVGYVRTCLQLSYIHSRTQAVHLNFYNSLKKIGSKQDFLHRSQCNSRFTKTTFYKFDGEKSLTLVIDQNHVLPPGGEGHIFLSIGKNAPAILFSIAGAFFRYRKQKGISPYRGIPTDLFTSAQLFNISIARFFGNPTEANYD